MVLVALQHMGPSQIELMSLALAGGFLLTGPPVKPLTCFSNGLLMGILEAGLIFTFSQPPILFHLKCFLLWRNG